MSFGPFQDILDQHTPLVTLLETHASLLVDAISQQDTAQSTARTWIVLTTRLKKTEELILFLKETAGALEDIWNKTQTGQPQSSAPISDPPKTSQPESASEPTLDASGLFSVDTNPTPVEQLFQSHKAEQPSSRGSKRKISDLEAPFEAIGLSDQQHTPKKSRSHGQTIPEADDSFERGVEAKLRAKAERKKARENKKRKRASDASSTRVNVKGPKNKKQKQLHDMKVEHGVQTNQGPKRQNSESKRPNSGTNNGGKHPNKKRKKSR